MQIIAGDVAHFERQHARHRLGQIAIAGGGQIAARLGDCVINRPLQHILIHHTAAAVVGEVGYLTLAKAGDHVVAGNHVCGLYADALSVATKSGRSGKGSGLDWACRLQPLSCAIFSRLA